MKVYAHRGASAEAPENTLRAFGLALDLGADGIELDVRLSADGVPVVLHDEGLDRTTTGTGAVREYTVAELRRLDADSGQTVPTLAEVIELVSERALLDVEIKSSDAGPATFAALSGIDFDSWAISSFDWNVLRSLRAMSQRVELWPLTHEVTADALQFAQEIGAPMLAVYHLGINAQVVERARERGIELMVWTVNDRVRAHELAQLGVNAVCTDDPRSIRSIVEAT